MTKAEKLLYHLEMVIWADLPEGTRLDAAQINKLIAKATPDQHARAFQRALVRSPMLVGEERGSNESEH